MWQKRQCQETMWQNVPRLKPLIFRIESPINLVLRVSLSLLKGGGDTLGMRLKS